MSDIGLSTAKFITPSSAWDNYLKQLSKFGLNDIYFDHRYVSLNIKAGSASQAEAFVYEESGDIFFMAYIRSPILNELGFWDFETAYGYSGPIASSDDKIFLQQAWNTFASMAKQRKIVVGLIRFHPLLETDRFSKHGEIDIFYECDTVWLDCRRALSDILKDYPKKLLQRLRRSEREGVLVKKADNVSAIYEFQEIYLSRMENLTVRDEYNFDESYFKAISELDSEQWSVYLAYSQDGKVIGGCLLLFSNKFCHYHLSGSLNKYFKLSPNDMLRHKVIKDMLDSDIEEIHFGGGRTSEDNDSLLSFKLKFSKQTCKFKMGSILMDPNKYESICRKWETANPSKHDEFNGFLLKYRF